LWRQRLYYCRHRKDDPEHIFESKEEYEMLKEVHDHFTTPEMLAQVNYDFLTQKNETMNKCISHTRIALTITTNSIGFEETMKLLYPKFGCPFGTEFMSGWEASDRDRKYIKVHCSRVKCERKMCLFIQR
jgi:hypothetical protein